MRRILLILTVLAALVAAGTATAGGPPVSRVMTIQKDVTDAGQADINPCTGNPAVTTSIGHFVFNVTVFADGSVHVLFTMHGYLSVDSVDPAEADYTGMWTEASTFNGTNGSAVGTSTFTPQLNGTDGSRLRYHYTSHITVNANGDVSVTFDKAVQHVDCA